MKCLLPTFAVLIMALLASSEAGGQESTAPPPEMKVLERILGTWKIEIINKVAKWTAKETRSTITQRREKVLGGHFIQETGFDEQGKTINIGMFTYDSDKKAYRFWFFESKGNTIEATGTWDESNQTFTYTGRAGGDVAMVLTNQFLDKSTVAWTYTIRDTGGEVGLRMEGTAKRAPSRPKTTDDAEVIRKLIPAASAMARQDMDRLARSHTTPKASDIEEKSLTLMLFALRPKDDKEAKEQFQYLTEVIPKPADIARELYRGDLRVGKVALSKGPVTFIHADRVTDCTCKVDGDTAKGTVSFEAPKLYKGKVEYVAKRKDGRWQVQEFMMSAYAIHLVRNAKGMWVTAVDDSRGGE